MLIRSQDRKELLNMDNVTALTLDGPGTDEDEPEKTVTAYMIDSSAYFIGTYSTEEKAMKVLDEIEDGYLETTNVQAAYGEDYRGLVCQPVTAIFTMPEDTEAKNDSANSDSTL